MSPAFAPAAVIELGTNVGISSAYIAAGLKDGILTTLESSAHRLRLAQDLHGDLKRASGLLIGSGEMGEMVAEALLADGNKKDALPIYKSLATAAGQPKHVKVAATRGILACAGK